MHPVSSQTALLPSGGPFLAHHGPKWRFFIRSSSLFNVFIIAVQATSIAIFLQSLAQSQTAPYQQHLSNIYRTSVETLSNNYRKSFEHLSNICRNPIEQLSKIFRKSWRKSGTIFEKLLKDYRKTFVNLEENLEPEWGLKWLVGGVLL